MSWATLATARPTAARFSARRAASWWTCSRRRSQPTKSPTATNKTIWVAAEAMVAGVKLCTRAT